MDVSGSGVGRKCELGTGSDKNRKPSTINTKKVLNAASEVASAITLSDEDVAALCRESVKWMVEQKPGFRPRIGLF